MIDAAGAHRPPACAPHEQGQQQHHRPGPQLGSNLHREHPFPDPVVARPGGEAGGRRQRQQQRPPGAPTGVAGLELRAQLITRLFEPPAHGPRGHPLARGDLRRREILVVTEQERRSQRLLEAEREFRHHLLRLHPESELLGVGRGGGRHERGRGDRLLARAAPMVSAAVLAHDIGQDHAQPGAQALAARGRVGEARDPELLNRVVRCIGPRPLLAHERGGQALAPRVLGPDVIQAQAKAARVVAHTSIIPPPPARWRKSRFELAISAGSRWSTWTTPR
jgi:hypothetical protein